MMTKKNIPTGNDLQLITTVSVEANITDDQVLMASDLENLSKRMEIEEIVTDAGYIDKTASESTKKHELKYSVTALKECKKDKDKLGVEDFDVEINDKGKPMSIKCSNKILQKELLARVETHMKLKKSIEFIEKSNRKVNEIDRLISLGFSASTFVLKN